MPLFNNLVKLTYVRNTGAAFSMFVGFSPYLAVVGLIVAAVVIYYHYRVPANKILICSSASPACSAGASAT